MTLLNNFSGAVFLALMGVESLGVGWTHWTMLVMTFGGVVALANVKLNYRRLEMDHVA